MSVVTNPVSRETFDNYALSPEKAVVTKSDTCAQIGNDGTLGFIRVRKRRLKDGASSASYDLVRAERVGGKPQHKFVLGLGSLKDYDRCDYGVMWFWVKAVHRMKRHELDQNQRDHVAADMVRKGACLPTAKQCDFHNKHWPHDAEKVAEVIRWIVAKAVTAEEVTG
jgi:hypothetical protein